MKNIESHNAIVAEAFNNNVMARCPNCFRTFLEDRIEVHLRSCTADNPHKPSKTLETEELKTDIKTYSKPKIKTYEADENKPKGFNKPKALMCHIW